MLPAHLNDEIDRVLVDRRPGRVRQVDAIEAARPMRVRREGRVAHDGRAATLGHGNIEPGERQNPQRIQRGLLDGLVAEDSRDTHQRQMTGCVKDGDGVVMTRIAVD